MATSFVDTLVFEEFYAIQVSKIILIQTYIHWIPSFCEKLSHILEL